MYNYPVNDFNYFSKLLDVSPNFHSMGNSLIRYMKIKVHPLLDKCDYKKVVVQGLFDRSSGISSKEKNDKLFNYIRPTAITRKTILYINCFPGIDYVFHYGNIMKSYISLTHRKIKVSHVLPSEEECWQAIAESEMKYIPKPHTVIMGYVEGLQDISTDATWHGTGNYLWKYVHLSSGDGILLGCKHTYWGEIAGRIVKYLALNGVKRVIYSGKLGTLNPDLVPNLTIATGNTSILPNGQIVKWKNMFDGIIDSHVSYGVHMTVPSVLQETKEWLNSNRNIVDFVDPEIGHMAYVAENFGIEFSYFHIISDNLSSKFDSDLSNERRLEVIQNRKQLCKKIGKTILQL